MNIATPHDELWALIQDTPTCVLTSISPEGDLHAQPLTVCNHDIDADGTLWFFVDHSDEVAHDVLDDPQVSASFAHPHRPEFVCVSGLARLVRDPQRKRELWAEGRTGRCFGSPDDPHIALLGLRVTHATYWNVQTQRMVEVFKLTRASSMGLAGAAMRAPLTAPRGMSIY